MRAVVYDNYTTDLDDLEVREVAEPKVMAGSVLIEVKAAAVNPVDWKLMAGYLDPMIDSSFPVIPGWDVAGVVVGLGSTPPSLRSVTRCSPTHERVSCSTARLLRIAVARGARVIGTASEQNHEFLRGLGAEPIVYGDALEARVLALAGGPVDAVADFVGGQLETTLAVLREGGAHASIADESVTEHDGHYIWVRPDGAETARLVELAREGNLTVEIAGVFSLEQVADAFRASMSGRIRGKLIVVP